MTVDQPAVSAKERARDFGALMEARMNRAGLRRSDLAQKMHVSKSKVHKAMNGNHLPAWETVIEILTTCGVDPETIEAEFRPAWEHARNHPSPPLVFEPEHPPVPEAPATAPRTRFPRVAQALMIATTVTLIGVGAAYLPLARHRTEPGGSGSGTPSPLPRPHGAVDTVPAGMTFAEIGPALRTTTDPNPTGRYHYVHTQVWTTGTDGRVLGHDEQVWWASDAPGRRTTATDTGADLAVQSVAPDDNSFSPLSTDEAVLATQLATQQRAPTTAAAMVLAVRSLYDTMCPTPTERAMIIDILAHTEGIMDDGHDQDRNERSGIAISTTVNGRDTYRMIFGLDGYPLEFEQTTTESGPPTVTLDEVYLEHMHTSRLP
jgi:transcriptional regulator with XRE-family HTH domain